MKGSSYTGIQNGRCWNIILVVIGVGLVLWGMFSEVSAERLWYWFDFRLWAWWLFGGVVVAVFLVTRRMRGIVEIIGILVCGVMILCRLDFDVSMYENGWLLAIRPGQIDLYDYQLYLPKGFCDFGEKRPLIVFLHGAGEVGIDVDRLKGWNLRDYVKQDISTENFPFIMVAPVTPKHGWEPERVVEFIDELMGQVGGRLNIDPDRVYLTGYSMGGGGTFTTACEHPDRFAAIVPVAGYGDPEKADALQKIPTWAFHGDADDCVDYRSTARMIERMRTLKHPNVKFTTLKGYGHGIVSEVYSRPELYRWLLKQKRSRKKPVE